MWILMVTSDEENHTHMGRVHIAMGTIYHINGSSIVTNLDTVETINHTENYLMRQRRIPRPLWSYMMTKRYSYLVYIPPHYFSQSIIQP